MKKSFMSLTVTAVALMMSLSTLNLFTHDSTALAATNVDSTSDHANRGSDSSSSDPSSNQESWGGSDDPRIDYTPLISSQIELVDLTDQKLIDCRNSSDWSFTPEAGHRYQLTMLIKHCKTPYRPQWEYQYSVAEKVRALVNLPRMIEAGNDEQSIQAFTYPEGYVGALKAKNEISLEAKQDLCIVYEPNSARQWDGLRHDQLWTYEGGLRVVQQRPDAYHFDCTLDELSYGASEIVSFEFSVLTPSEYNRTHDGLKVELMGLYNGSQEHPGPSVTTLQNSVKAGSPYFEEPVNGEGYYATFRIKPPRYARNLTDNTDIFTGLTYCPDGYLRFAADLMSSDVICDTAALSYEFAAQNFHVDDLRAVFWTTREVELPSVVYSSSTGIRSAYRPVDASYTEHSLGKIELDRPAQDLDIIAHEPINANWHSIYHGAPNSIEGDLDYVVYVTYCLRRADSDPDDPDVGLDREINAIPSNDYAIDNRDSAYSNNRKDPKPRPTKTDDSSR